ncbi:MAG TPA: Mrp/NBP35 family ATP-binding protein [Methylovirgula sp.]|nr:Mrp/NBP35 family ATP-binding protein [Methylovirgula sp.]
MVTEQEVLNVLRSVPGPDGKTPLPESGAIAGLTIRDGKVYLSIAVAPERAAALEDMRGRAERALRTLPGVATALVSLTSQKAPPETRVGPGRRPSVAGTIGIPGVARIIAVASGKGGVGKSTTAVNLALALQALGWRIGVLDCDIYGPSLPRLLDLRSQPQVEDRRIQPLHAYGVKAMSIGFMIDENEPVVWRGPMVMAAVQQMLRDVNWGELDCLVVDMPPGTGDAQLTLAQNVALAGAVIVSTPQDLALVDARRGIAMFNKVDVPVLGIVENMSYFLCPHCGGRSDIFAHGGARHEAERLGVPFLGEVPLALGIRETSDAGRPIVVAEPQSGHAAAYRDIAAQIRAALEQGRTREAPRILVE